MMMATEFYLYIILMGTLAGFLNITSAGGSLIVLPGLIFMGVPPNVANASNRIAIFIQNLVGCGMYQKKSLIDWEGSPFLILPALTGALFGAYIATIIDGESLKFVIGVVMILMTLSMIYRPGQWLKKENLRDTSKFRIWGSIGMFIAGCYGGFIQAGVGVILLFSLVRISGYTIKQANPLKIVVTLFYTAIALGVFIYYDMVDYKLGFILAVGNTLGAILGVKFSIWCNEKIIHRILIAVLFVLSLKMLGVFDFLIEVVKNA